MLKSDIQSCFFIFNPGFLDRDSRIKTPTMYMRNFERNKVLSFAYKSLKLGLLLEYVKTFFIQVVITDFAQCFYL